MSIRKMQFLHQYFRCTYISILKDLLSRTQVPAQPWQFTYYYYVIYTFSQARLIKKKKKRVIQMQHIQMNSAGKEQAKLLFW